MLCCGVRNASRKRVRPTPKKRACTYCCCKPLSCFHSCMPSELIPFSVEPQLGDALATHDGDESDVGAPDEPNATANFPTSCPRQNAAPEF